MDEVVRERDFYRSLVDLATCEAPESLARESLRILVELTQAQEAYIELRLDPAEEVPTWWVADGCDAARVSEIRDLISHGIVAQAIATGEIIVTPSAMHDARFQERGSVREHAIETVLCVPIGNEAPLGAVYLQANQRGGVFLDSDAVLAKAEAFARVLEPIASHMLSRERAARASTPAEGDAFAGVLGKSRTLREAITRLRLVAPLDVHVLLTGPSGTGKSMLARAIHYAGDRKLAPFVALNCATIPENLLESELFGAERGAHSAVPRGGMKGKVEAAEEGTLFLDEVGELPLPAQAKLLQLIQDRTYYRLGGVSARKADVRIVAATNVDLKRAVAERRFREDLYYRLRVFEARVPPLSERVEDLSLLAAHFCEIAASRHSLGARRLSPGAVRAIQTAEWPGNVRELANHVESATLAAHLRGATVVEPQDLFPHTQDSDPGRPRTLHEVIRRARRNHVLATLEGCDWNVSEAARRLDIARSYVYSLVRDHDLRRE